MSLAVGQQVDDAVSFGRELASLYRDRNVSFMAGSIAYAAFISLIPSVVLLFVVASTLGGDAFQAHVLQTTGRYLTTTSQGVLETSIAQATEQVKFSVLALAALLWAVLKVFRTLDTAFSELYGVDSDGGIVGQIADGLVVVVGMTAAFLTMVAVGVGIALASSSVDPGLVPSIPGFEYVGVLALLVALTVVFVPVYYVFPDVSVTIREVLPGALLAAVGWTLLQGVFQLYVSTTSTSEFYGAIGGVILVITWLYFGAVVLLLGAATNVVLAGRDAGFEYSVDRSTA